MDYYLPDGTTTDDIDLWAREHKRAFRVGDDKVAGVRVSTVFLGMDHQYGDGPPLIWETLTFGGWGEVCRRYTTREQAEQGHRDVCALVRRRARRWRLARWVDDKARWFKWVAEKVGGDRYPS